MIPDVAGYAALFGLDHPPCLNAASQYRYNRLVFFAPAWESIYATDEERTMSIEAATEFGGVIRSIYEQSGYELVDLPYASVEERARFILNSL